MLTQDQKDNVAAIKDLISSGDIFPQNAKDAFKKKYNRLWKGTDDKLVEVYASQDDDYGTDDIVNRMMAVELGKDLNWDGEQEEYAATS